MARLGTLTFQAPDNSDIFLTEDIYLDGKTDPGEAKTELAEPGLDESEACVSGKAPRLIPLDVEGDAAVLFGWFKGETFSAPFTLQIYIQYEEVEEVEQQKREMEDCDE